MENGKSGIFTDSRNGKSYKWIKIGSQIWMAENLAIVINKESLSFSNFEKDGAILYV
jgi:uncharacterized protein (TIGR02145 family)